MTAGQKAFDCFFLSGAGTDLNLGSVHPHYRVSYLRLLGRCFLYFPQLLWFPADQLTSSAITRGWKYGRFLVFSALWIRGGYGLRFDPPVFIRESLHTPVPQIMVSHLEIGSLQMHLVEMKSLSWCPYRMGKSGCRWAERESTWQDAWSVLQEQRRVVVNHQKLEDGHAVDSQPSEGPSLLAPWSQISSL